MLTNNQSGTHAIKRATSTDSRPLAERKASVTLRISELRQALAAAERASADLDAEIEQLERDREAQRRAEQRKPCVGAS